MNRGETGETRVRGRHMMLEYESNIEETKTTIRDGFIYIGDVGFVDDEVFLSITDRRKDVILVKGRFVFPRKIEE